MQSLLLNLPEDVHESVFSDLWRGKLNSSPASGNDFFTYEIEEALAGFPETVSDIEIHKEMVTEIILCEVSLDSWHAQAAQEGAFA